MDTINRVPTYKIPFDLIREYYHREPGARCQKRDERREESDERREKSDERRETGLGLDLLNLKGKKTFGISIGSNRNILFDQSMELRLNNTFSNDLKVEGVLRDDNLPIQPDGNTQELKELDEVYINIKKDRNQVRFGDYRLELNESKLGQINRELEGISGSLDTTMLLSGGISKGKWIRKEFEGIMGKQGPYELSQYVIVAGSENVRVVHYGVAHHGVNGKSLHRGKDYTIDYADGSLMFTNSFPVEDGDRIFVTFQEMEDEYKTTIFSGSRKIRGLNLVVFKEEDMKGSLNKSQFEDLKVVSQDSTYAWVSGATFKGAGKGSYIKLDSIYEYMGFNKGDYEVNFTKVGAGSTCDVGDYEFDGVLGGYKYVGAGEGSYIPMIRIPLPQKNVFVDINYAKELNGIKLEFEGGATRFERNALQEDADFGKAFRGAIETRKEHWNAGINFRQLDSVFHFPGELDTCSLRQEEIFGGFAPVSFLEVESKVIRMGKDIGSQFGVNFTPLDFPNICYKHFNSKDGRINEFTLSHNIFGVSPFYSYINKVVHHGENEEELIEVGIQNKVFTISTGERRRKFVGVNDEVSYTNKISISKKPLDLSYIYKQKFREGNRYIVDLGNLKFNFHGIKLNYKLTSLEQGLFREEFYEVANGKGSFSALGGRDSTGIYYPDPHGNYEKKLVPCDESKISRDFSFLNSFTFHPISGLSVKLGTLKRGNGEKIRLWERVNNAFDDRNQMNMGVMTNNLYASYVKKDYRENKIEGIRESGKEGIFDANIRYQELELKYRTRETKRWTQVRTIWEEKANTAGVGISQKLNRNTSLHLMVEGEERVIESFKFYGYSNEPGVDYNLGNKMLDVRVKLTHWLSDDQVPLNIRAIYPSGTSLDWAIKLTFFSGESREYILGYQGNKTPNYPAEHTLNAQLQINF